MPLTDLQRKKLIDDINRLNINVVLKYFLSGDISLSDVPHITDDRRKFIEEHLPAPAQMDWNALQASLSEVSVSTLLKLETYIRKYEGTRPDGNHVDEAIAKRNEIKDALQREALAKEEDEWNTVDPFSMTSLIGHLNKYPMSAHHDEIDDKVWNIIDKESEQQLQDYKVLFPKGKYIEKAIAMLEALDEWMIVRNSGDISFVFQYIRKRPESPYIDKAYCLLMDLKHQEICRMRREPNRYDVSRLLYLVRLGIFTVDELISEGVMTENVWNTLNSIDVKNDLPDIYEAMKKSKVEYLEGGIDVYFFGLPCTGKTCLLQGLSCTTSLQVDLAASSGPYAEALRQYTDCGIVSPRTLDDSVTTLKTTIITDEHTPIKNNVNFVEMSGHHILDMVEDNGEYSKEVDNRDIANLLHNDNRKVFFLIIDPTTKNIKLNREYDEYDEQTGEKIHRLKYDVFNQKIFMQKIVNIFQDPANSDIMRKVDSIHIIITKADTFGERLQRREKALDYFNNHYAMNIVPPLTEVCRDYNINCNSNYRPKLFTFSLGKFYVGGLYEYDPIDSELLVNTITAIVPPPYRKETFWSRLTEKIINKLNE